ncbi:tyrosine-type recombinase/integrase [Candidatus Kapaibacterium sp.]
MSLIRFNLHKRNDSKKIEKSIKAVVTIFKTRFSIDTGKKINPEFWDPKTNRPKKNYPNYQQVYLSLNEIEKNVIDCYNQILRNNPKVSKKMLKDAIIDVIAPSNQRNQILLVDMIQNMINDRNNILSANTIRGYNSLKAMINEFQSYSKEKLFCDEFDLRTQRNFINFMTTEKSLINSTQNKIINQIKTVLNYAADNKVNIDADIKHFKVKTKRIDRIALSIDEVNRLLELDLSHNVRLDKIKDIFLFAIFTGQRFQDLMNLKKVDIDESGMWKLYQKKTKTLIWVPIAENISYIINKYPGKFVLPRITNSTFNKYVKELCQIAGFDEMIQTKKYKGNTFIDGSTEKYNLVSAHTARRTFITIALSLNIPSEIIKKISGHLDSKSFEMYQHFTKSASQNAINIINDKFSKQVI